MLSKKFPLLSVCNYCSVGENSYCEVCKLSNYYNSTMTRIKYNNKDLWAHRYCREFLFIDKKNIILTIMNNLICDICNTSEGQLIKCVNKDCNKFSHIICCQILTKIVILNNIPVSIIIYYNIKVLLMQ